MTIGKFFMRVGVIGINHKSADLTFREAFAKVCSRRFDPAHSFHGPVSYILLSTCNRTEIYFSSYDLAETHTYLLTVLRQDLEEIDFEHRLYAYFGEECFFHLARVTCGMDSALIGETEIQGQVKKAYMEATVGRKLAKELHFMFQKCLKIGKNVRSSLSLGSGMLTLEEAILKTTGALLGDLTDKEILFVGISQINHKIFTRFKQRGFKKITFCNRSLERAHKIQAKENVSLALWEDVRKWHTYDLAIFGTKAKNYIIKKEGLPFFRKKKCLVIDLAVPRNVDPKIGKHPCVTLLNVDQINQTTSPKQRLQAEHLARIETQFIAHHVGRQTAIFARKTQNTSLAAHSIA